MKKRTLTYLGMVLLNVLFAAQLFAQTNVNMPYNTGAVTFTLAPPATCFFNFFDNGGAAATYSNSSNPLTSIVTFAPSNAATQRVRATFSAFATENTFDALFIYNGNVAETPNIANAGVNTLLPNQINSGAGQNNTFRAGGFQGGTSPGVVTSTAASGALTFQFDSDTSVTCAGWTAVISEVPLNPCTITAGAVQGTSAQVGATCTATPVVASPTFAPAGCATGYTFQYNVDGGAFTTLAQPLPATITLPTVGVGAHTVIYRLIDPCSGAVVSSTTQTITAVDVTPPTITCPGNLTFNLASGECSTFASYTVTGSDNCPFAGPLATLTTNPGAANNGNASGGMIFFNLVNNGTQPITISGLGVNITNGTTINVYRKSGTHVGFETNAGAWTLATTANANAGPFAGAFPGNGTITNAVLAAPIVIPVGTTGIGLHMVSAASNYTNGTGANQTFTSGNLTLNAGYASNGLFAAGFTPRVFNGSVTFQTVTTVAPVVQTAGLPSGSEFPLGTTQNCFSLTDGAGLTSSCCFNVTVNEYPNATQNLACSDNVQISLDQACTAEVTAQDILVGGPYGCFDTRYTVMIITPLGGTISPAIVNQSYIGNGPHVVKVVDNLTGQSCWGSVVVEDKLAPVLVCRDLSVDCTTDLNDPAIAQPAPFVFDPQTPVQFPASFVPHGGGLAFNLQGNGLPQGDYWNITNNTATPIQISGFGVRLPDPAFGAVPAPVNFEIFNRPTTFAGFETNAAAWTNVGPAVATVIPPYFANGTGPLTQVVLASPVDLAPGATTAFHLYSPTASIVFNYTFGVQPPVVNGPLTLLGGPSSFGQFGPLFNPGANTIPNIQVNYAIQLDPIVPTDNCTNPVNLTHIDNFTDGACGGPSGTMTRTWKATDAYGNMATCVQVITIERPDLDDVETPGDVQWTCEQYNAFPNIINPTPLHPYITDTDPGTDIINVNLDPNCDDLDLNLGTPQTQDNPAINATNLANGGIGCPGSNPFNGTNGLDDADVLALTGSGIPSVNGLPLQALCEISYEHTDLTVNVCPGTFKIVRRWTLIDWCANPVDVRSFDQLIKVVDNVAPNLDLFAVAGDVTNSYGTHSIPALGDGGGCNQEPQLSGGTKYFAHVQLPGSATPEFYNNVRLDRVAIEVDHARLSDLDIFLKSPAGFVIELSSNNGGNGTKMNANFYDAAAGNVTASQFNVIGDFKPEGSTAPSCGGFAGNISTIAQFDSPNLAFTQEVLGNWELIVFDEVAQATGKVVKWKLFFTYSSINIDVYDAAVPQNNGPHSVCQGTVVVPPIDGTDNCSGVAGYTTELWTIVPGSNPALPMNQLGSVNGNGGSFFNIPLFQNGAAARYIIRYYAVDGCGNQSFVETVATLRDKVPPVPNCISFTDVSIANDGTGTGNSCARVYAEDLDNASYDNCRPVYFLMAKMADATSPNIFNRCYYPYRDFCCNNVGDNQVILLVLDQDPTPFFSTLNSPSLGCDGTPGLFLSQNFAFNTNGLNFNTCMVNVKVSDKLPPVLVSCPPNQRISCDWYADNLETQLAGLTTAQAKCNLLTSLNFGAPIYYDNCATVTTCNFSSNLDQCLEGTITRSWTTTDNAGNTALQPCTQTINVDHVSDWAVEFPADITVNCGANVPDFGEPEIFYETCELVAVSHDDQLFQVQGTDACYKIVRQWTVINWCVVGAEVDQEVVEQPENQLNLPFPQCDVDSDGDCDARTFRDSWRGTAPSPVPAVITGTYRLRPTVIDAHGNSPYYNPDTDPDTDPWDGYITYQQVIKVQDTVDPVFTNGCTIPDVCIEDNSCGATILLPEPEITECTDQYTVTVQIQIGGVWLNGFGPYLNVAPGTYNVRYIAHDFCNNQAACNTTVTVKDCKKPTPYCKNGLVIELMQTGMVDTWASDFDAGSFDNCPGALKLSFSANVNDIGHTYTCDDLGQQPVQIWVTDAAGNQDYCETYVIIQANMGQCDDDPLVAGTIATEANQAVENVTVNVNSPAGFNQNATSTAASQNGNYTVAHLDSGLDYTITPQYDQDHLNGVTTFDLVLISKHILGVTPLGSPYKIIAADANKSGTVTTFDLVEIRKLILFINTEFPNNTSWRFVDKNFVFPNANNPWATSFPEVINLNNVTDDVLNNNFVAIKIGDVNGSAATNLLGATEDRTMVGNLVFNTEDVNVEAGKTYTVDFKATDFNVSGYQFSLAFNNKSLEFVEVVPAVASASNFGTTLVNEGVITASWNSEEGNAVRLAKDEVVFSLTFKALTSGRLSEMMNINSSKTVAEAYNSNSELMNVAMSFNNNLVANGFDLYQNTPNPFASVTTIGFNLPEATSATLTISDVQGKVVKVINGDYSKGYNTVTLKRSDLGATGVLYYRLDTGSDSATRKMILVD